MGECEEKVDSAVKGTIDCMDKCYNGLTHLEAQFKSDYAKFVVERRRWKGDFDRATKTAQDNYSEIEDLLNESIK